jgi:hypothetical protein
MPFTLRPFRHFPMQCSVTYHAGSFLKLLLAYVLGFWLLITLLVLSSGPAYAEWVAVEKNNQVAGLQTVYVDPDTIRREGNLVTMWQLIDFQLMHGNAGMGILGVGHRVLSTKTHKQFDCPEKRLRLLAVTDFSGNIGTGIRDTGWCIHRRRQLGTS